MNQQTKLIVGLVLFAFLAVGIAQNPIDTNEPPPIKSEGKRYHAFATLQPRETNAPAEQYEIINASSSWTNATWRVDNNTPMLDLTISTNLSINWLPPFDEKPLGENVSAKQVGALQTNRVLTVIHDGTTNLVLLKILGKEEWPSQTRVVQVPARYRQ